MIAGLDIGTSGCKVVIFDLKGNEIYRSYKSYETIRSDGKKELEVNQLINAIKYVIKEAASKYEISALGIDSFGEAIVLLDENDKPLTNIIQSSDIRGVEGIDDLLSKISEKRIGEITGLKPDFTLSIFKAMWIKKHQPEVFARAKRILLMEDLAIYLLTGKPLIDYSLATRTCAFDLNTYDWSDEILNAAGIKKDLWSKPTSLLGETAYIKDSIKKELGISNEILIAPAGHDQVAAALGCGINFLDKAVDGSGTVECLTCIFDKPQVFDGLIKNSLCIVPYFDKCATYAYSFCGCCLVDWFKKNFAKGIDEKDIFTYLESDFVEKPSGILLLPHFAGAAVPYMDPNSKGFIWGLTLEHTTSNIYQAVLEGIAYEMKLNMDILKKNSISPKKIIATGGGANSLKWLQIKANILNLPIYKIKGKEAGCKGGAIIAGVISKEFNDIEEASKKMIHYADIIKPKKDIVKLYKTEFKRYQKLYKFGKVLTNVK